LHVEKDAAMRSKSAHDELGLNRVLFFAFFLLATADRAAASPPSMTDSLPDPTVLRYGPSLSPLSWKPSDRIEHESFVVPAAVVGIESLPISVHRVEFRDERPYGEKRERDAWLVRYASVPYGPPEGVPFNVVFDAKTAAVVCAFTDAADSWAQPSVISLGMQFADQSEIWGEAPAPAQYDALRSPVLEVLDAFVRAEHADLRKVGQVILRPRFFLNMWPKKELHGESTYEPANMWIVEQLGTPAGEEFGVPLTTLVAVFFDAGQSWKQTGLRF
jgi:hypothetical protein